MISVPVVNEAITAAHDLIKGESDKWGLFHLWAGSLLLCSCLCACFSISLINTAASSVLSQCFSLCFFQQLLWDEEIGTWSRDTCSWQGVTPWQQTQPRLLGNYSQVSSLSWDFMRFREICWDPTRNVIWAWLSPAKLCRVISSVLASLWVPRNGPKTCRMSWYCLS